MPRFKQKTYEEIKEYVYINFMSELEVLYLIKWWTDDTVELYSFRKIAFTKWKYDLILYDSQLNIVNLEWTELPFVLLVFRPGISSYPLSSNCV